MTTPDDTKDERSWRTALGVAAAVSASGVLLAGTVSRDVGGPVVVVGWIAFLYALHRFGRS
ncbi:MAG TPA: hypothetical protein VF316_16750 [Polyangiaceae bacterium]